VSVNTPRHVVGIDFGTLAGRALIVRVSDGEEVGEAVHEYRRGVMDETLAATGEREVLHRLRHLRDAALAAELSTVESR
jgi:ribulose kinase